ncbi:MAG: hypothetical protein J0I06_06005 [Planctomycetes bacterium]|nr:hypothetical protein [Planctomycetota bacterium]
MPKYVFRAGREVLARSLRGEAPASDAGWWVLLFVAAADLTPSSPIDSVEEASFSGYSRTPVPPSSQGDVTWDGDDPLIQIKGEALVWDCTADPQTIYGWIMFDADNDLYLFGEQYDTPHVLSVGSRHTLYASIKVSLCV